MSINSEKQLLSPDALISLYEINLNPIGVSFVFRFTNSGPVDFDGETYAPFDVMLSGMTYDGSGAFPTPKLTVANMAGLITPLIKDYNDLIGAKFTRIRTFRQFLDDGSDPDPSQIMPLDIFTIEQKTAHNKVFIEWRLSSVIDETDRMLPGRLVLRDYCPFSYRVYKGGSFDYSHVSCTYTGNKYFDESDKPVGQANDRCGRTLNSCMKRFGSRSELGFGGFPGVGKDKVY